MFGRTCKTHVVLSGFEDNPRKKYEFALYGEDKRVIDYTIETDEAVIQAVNRRLSGKPEVQAVADNNAELEGDNNAEPEGDSNAEPEGDSNAEAEGDNDAEAEGEQEGEDEGDEVDADDGAGTGDGSEGAEEDEEDEEDMEEGEKDGELYRPLV